MNSTPPPLQALHHCFAHTVILAFCAVLLPASPASAAIILSESFDYGGTAGSLVGKGTATGGWGGSWNSGTFNYGGLGATAADYQTGGLTFSTLTTTGGNAFVNASGNGGINVGRVHSSAITGTLYGSFLFRTPSGPQFTGLAALWEGGGLNSADNFAQFAIEPDKYNDTLGGTIMNGAYGSSAGTAMSANETYLVLYKVTNLGLAPDTHTATMWMLREGQFNNFITGGLTESELNGATLGLNSTDVLQRAVNTTGSMTAQFASGSMLLMQSYNGVQAQFDELRISDTSLDELVTVPEPGRSVLCVASAFALIFMRRRPRC